MSDYRCAECQEGDHSLHQPQWAGICVGCACEWRPDDEQQED